MPYVNYGLIALNGLIFVFTLMSGAYGEEIKERFALASSNLHLVQFFSYQFLHADAMHLFGNMVFLWIFGNSVNSKMGNVAYLLFYLAAGVFAGFGFALLSPGSCIGASGAVAGVTTAFLVLCPQTEVTLFYWIFIFLGTMHVRALIVIVVKLILIDNVLIPEFYGGAGIAYSAHMFGYFFGFSLCFLLLVIRALPRDQFDILALVKRHYQRQQFKAAMASPNDQPQAVFGRVAKPASVFTGRPIEASSMDETIIQMRSEIAEHVGKGDYTAAADLYEKLVARDPNQCLPRRNMITVANQLMTLGRYPQAAAAYEKHLKAYPKDSDVVQIKFLLGIIYAKYLQQYEAAEGFLRECIDRLTDGEQKKQADQWLQTVLSALGRGPSTT